MSAHYWSHREAATGLAANLAELTRLEEQASRYYGGLPFLLEAEIDRTVQSIRGAVVFLIEEDEQ